MPVAMVIVVVMMMVMPALLRLTPCRFLIVLSTLIQRCDIHEGRCRHIVNQVEERLQGVDHNGHDWPVLGVLAQALVGQHRRFLRALDRVLPVESWIHEPAQLP